MTALVRACLFADTPAGPLSREDSTPKLPGTGCGSLSSLSVVPSLQPPLLPTILQRVPLPSARSALVPCAPSQLCPSYKAACLHGGGTAKRLPWLPATAYNVTQQDPSVRRWDCRLYLLNLVTEVGKRTEQKG